MKIVDGVFSTYQGAGLLGCNAVSVVPDVSKDFTAFILPLLRSLPLLHLLVCNPLWPSNASIDHTYI